MQSQTRDPHIGRKRFPCQPLPGERCQRLSVQGVQGDLLKRPRGAEIALEHAKTLHLAHDVVLLDNPHPVHLPLWLYFDQINRHPRFAQGDGRTQPANAAADDQNLIYFHRVFTFSHRMGKGKQPGPALTNRDKG